MSRLIHAAVAPVTVLLFAIAPSVMASDTWHQEPFRIEVGGMPLDTANAALGGDFDDSGDRMDRAGHAAPYFADVDGDGRRDLVVGSFAGLFRLYRNVGTDTQPLFDRTFTWLTAGEERARVRIYCCVASGPQLVDIDGDGVLDLSSGSYDPGLVYWFKGLGGGRYATRQILTSWTGSPVFSSAGRDGWPTVMSNIAWVLWNDDDRPDMLIGDVSGRLSVFMNTKAIAVGVTPIAGQPTFERRAMEILIDGGKAVSERHSAPAAVDWDGDGLWDILIGTDTGAVYFLRNTGKAGAPEFKTRQQILPPGEGIEQWVEPGNLPRRGIRAQIHAADYNGDGRLDLLVGDWSYTQTPRIDLTKKETHELQILRTKLAAIDKKAGYDFLGWRGMNSYHDMADLRKQAEDLQKRMTPYLQRYRHKEEDEWSSLQAHGQVWVFLRKPATSAPGSESLRQE